PKYTQNFIWLGKKVRNVFRAFFVLRKETIGVEDSENAVRKAGGTFPCIQRVFLSIMNGRGKLWWAGIVVSAFSRARGGRAEDFAALPG
ncbi:MAG: hypothetical protein KBE54_06175, partial [Bilophila sp.]|nr:hypothetical protein [Bilophila sp.]